MYSPCVRPVVIAQRLLYIAVRVLGPGVLPGRRDAWKDPVETEIWNSFNAQWQELCGIWDSAALYQRPQSGRSGFALLLLREGRGVGFIRVTASRLRAEKEFSVMRAVHAARPETFSIARPLGHGHGGEWAWLATESVPNYPLGAVRRSTTREKVTAEISTVLDEVLQRGSETPRHWQGSHGDLAPWNLRTEWGGAVRVIDWEDAAFAPPGVDLLYGALTAHLTFGARLPTATNIEAAQWVAELVSTRRTVDEGMGSVNNRLLAALECVPAH